MKTSILEILKEQKDKGYKNSLYHYTQIIFAYNSNHLEGNTLSKEQTRLLYETNSFLAHNDQIIKTNDILEIKNHFLAFDFILDTALQKLSLKYFKTLHSIIKKDCSDIKIIGDFKQTQNFIGINLFNATKTTHPKNVKKALSALLKKYNKNIESKSINELIDFHYHFEKIHPFEDGNGRLGRLILFKECLKYGLTPFIIDESHRLFYYKGLQEYERQKGYLIDTCLACQDSYTQTLKDCEIIK